MSPCVSTIGARVEAVSADAYTVPANAPEADGTFAWTSTTLVVVEVRGGGMTGLGYTYSESVIADLIRNKLAACLNGRDVMDPPGAWRAMAAAARNMGLDSLAATAIAAMDASLWDLKARLLGLPLALMLGRARDAVPGYGSGGFTTCRDDQLRTQLAGWVERDGCRWIKMKVSTQPALHRHMACAAPRVRHLERFHDHVCIKHMLFDGAPVPVDGVIRPDLSQPGMGLDFKRPDAASFRV